MKYELMPDPAGDLAEGTVLDRSEHPPIVKQLTYELEYWDGDDLLATFPIYVVTTRLQAALEASDLTGFRFAPMTVTTSQNFDELHTGRVPELVWMKVTGNEGADDLWTGDLAELRITERAMALLREFNIEHCLINEIP